MRQVPKNPFSSYGVIGSGRVATQFANYLSLLNLPFTTWSRKQNTNSAEEALNFCSHILVLISDRAIEPFILENEHWLNGKTIVHFSGSIQTHEAFGCHPLTTFSLQPYKLEVYKSIPFIIDADVDFNELLPGLENLNFYLPYEQKKLYHALCVASGNFTVLLWQAVMREFETKLSLPKEVLQLYLQQTAVNLLKDPDNALTGPLARGDYKTVDSNLSSLKDTELYNVYLTFVNLFESLQKNQERKNENYI